MSESSTPEDIPAKTESRRTFLTRIKNIGKAAGAVAGVNVAAQYLGSLTPDVAPPPTPIEYENFSMKNNSLRVVMTEHDEADWTRNQATIEKEVANARIVIPEYFPPEYRYLQHTYNPIYRAVAGYNATNGLFEHIADLSVKEKKPVWVVDPEHNEQGANLRIELNTPALLGEIATFVAMGTARKKFLKEQMTRRDLLKRLAAVGVVGGVPIGAALLEAANIENDFRHVVSAELLDRVDTVENPSQTPDPNSQQRITMFIPKAHWQGIKSYLSNPEARKERLDIYTQLFGKQLPTLFEARHYEAGDASGNPKDKIKIPT